MVLWNQRSAKQIAISYFFGWREVARMAILYGSMNFSLCQTGIQVLRLIQLRQQR